MIKKKKKEDKKSLFRCCFEIFCVQNRVFGFQIGEEYICCKIMENLTTVLTFFSVF